MASITRFALILSCAFYYPCIAAEALDAATDNDIWVATVGEGFHSGTIEAGFSFGAGPGMHVLGSSEAHDLALGELHVGWIFTDVVAADHWYRGNWELLGELFGGWQFSPETDYVAGITPLLRYNFVTGTRFVPYVEAGVGGAFTDIDAPDLSGDWQFSLGGGVGVHWFFRENVALNVHYRWLHLSNGGREKPNNGSNTSLFHLGVSWFF